MDNFGKHNIDFANIRQAFEGYADKRPFPFAVVDNFFTAETAQALEAEFPEFEDSTWHEYDNAIEVKKTCNNWNIFPPLTYRVFEYLNSEEFRQLLGDLTEITPLYADGGLNGGGWHIHKQGGKLNPHLDYSLHPKLPWQRKLNLLVYLNGDWQEGWGGELGLWAASADGRSPGTLEHKITPRFNRAVLFDTTCNSFHGLVSEVASPEGQCRKSIAVYYLTLPASDAADNKRALFFPTAEQQGDKEVQNLIKKRSSVSGSKKVYKKQ